MEEVQRMVGESGEAVAIKRDWELKDEAVNWLVSQKGYVQLNRFDYSAVTDADQEDEYVLLLQVLRDLKSLKRACSAGKEEVVVTRCLVEQEEAEGGVGGAACELLASSGYLECPKREQSRSDERVDAEQDDFRYYYRTADCKLRLPASDTDNDAVEKQPIEGHRGAEDVSQEGWKVCQNLVWDSSRMRGTHEQLSVSAITGDGTTVQQTPIIRFQLEAWARADEFHLDVRLQVRSLSVGVSKKEFTDTNTCLGFFPDCIRFSMEPMWVEKHMSEAIFESLHSTSLSPSGSSAHSTTRNTEIGVTLGGGMAPAQLCAKMGWGNSNTTTRVEDHDVTDVIECETEEGGVASVEWQLRRWGNGKLYRSDRLLSLSWISSKKLPKLPFKGTTPPLKNLAPVSWRLPLSALPNPQQKLMVNIRVRFHMCLISLKEGILPYVKEPRSTKFPLEQEIGPFFFELPSALCAADVTPS